MTIPGIGFYSALAIYSEIGEIPRFTDAKHVSAYCSLVPRVHQSGDTTRHGHITKFGPPILRFFLVNSVHTTVKNRDIQGILQEAEETHRGKQGHSGHGKEALRGDIKRAYEILGFHRSQSVR